MLWSRSARPLRAALPRRSRSRDEGVECGSVSASVRRARLRAGTLAGAAAELFGFAAAFFFTFLARTVFLADAFRLTGRFGLGRLAERRATGFFLLDLEDFARFGAFRLAMT